MIKKVCKSPNQAIVGYINGRYDGITNVIKILGEGGARGIIFDLGGKIVKTFAWGLRTKTNNDAEWMMLIHGLELIDWGSISKLLVFGDSRQVILKMQSGYSKGSIRCKKNYDRITLLNIPPHVLFLHILRGNNGQVNNLENIGDSMPQGSMVYNGQSH